MKTLTGGVLVLLFLGSGVVGYLVGSNYPGIPGSVSSATTSSNYTPQFYIPNATWTVYSNTIESGSCSTGYVTGPLNLNSGSQESGPGYPDANCSLTLSASQSGNVTLYITNSGFGRVYFAFAASSSYPYNVFFVSPQGCPLDAEGFCGYVEGNSTTSYQLIFLAAPGNYKAINMTLDIELAPIPPI